MVAAKTRRPSDRVARLLGVSALVTSAALLGANGWAQPLSPTAYRVLSAAPLALTAAAVLAWQWARGWHLNRLAKVGLLAAGFAFWAAYQAWPLWRHATLLNDLAIGCFVADAVLAVVARDRESASTNAPSPPAAPDGANP
jgi:hypothetical protein